MPRFAIRHLLAFTAFVGIGCAALLNARHAWTAMAAGALLMLAVAVLLAVFSHGAGRAYWFGFAFFGWLYFGLCWYGFATSPDVRINPTRYSSDPFARPNRVTARISGFAYDRWLAERDQAEIARQKSRYPTVDAQLERDFFIVVADVLWTVVIAIAGGWLASWLYARKCRRQPD
jgi:hypothetical protein